MFIAVIEVFHDGGLEVVTYDVVVLEDKEWLTFGTRTFVFPVNILRKQCSPERSSLSQRR